MFEQTFKNIDDILHKDAGCTSELDYTEQSSWLLFLKYLDALEADKATEAVLEGRDYLYYLLLAPTFTEYAIKGSARAGMPKVNREHLFAYQFLLPKVQYQKRITENLDQIANETIRLESIYRQKLTALDDLKKSLLHQAFSGQL
jgi:Type I restriction modification DNA specificity domain/HsdM N-terminal domain